MNTEEKINKIGKMLVEIQLDINYIKINQKELRDFITNSNKLDFERLWKKIK